MGTILVVPSCQMVTLTFSPTEKLPLRRTLRSVTGELLMVSDKVARLDPCEVGGRVQRRGVGDDPEMAAPLAAGAIEPRQ